jgi:phosphatidate cytidylyltransferase
MHWKRLPGASAALARSDILSDQGAPSDVSLNGASPQGATQAAAKARTPSELAIRTGSALIMIGLALAAAWFGGWGWAIASGFVMGLCAYEWSKMADSSRRYASAAVPIAILCGIGFVIGPELVQVASCVVVAGALALASQRGGSVGVVGAGYIALSGYALASLRMIGDEGQLLLILLFAIVWSTDTAAYFTGRALGGPKLWPRVSPKKTWWGFVGGCTAAITSAMVVAALADKPWYLWGGLALFVSISAQAGDLLESSAKRHFGVKDSNSLIPGHGGVLDRIDGHLSAALALSLVISVPWIRGLLL